MTDYGIPRDRWGRPTLAPPDSAKKVGYPRMSTMAKALDDKSNLVDWKASMAMLGLMKSKPLQSRVAAINAKGGGWQKHKQPLKEIAGRATDLAGSSGAADEGTAVHEFTELVDAGLLVNLDGVPEHLKGPVEAYADRTEDLSVLDTEVFGCVDHVVDGEPMRVAGSMDRVVMFDGLPVVGDLKTGANEPKYPLGVTTQVAGYANCSRYRDDVFEGSPPFDGVLDSNGVSYRAPIHPGLSLETGLLIHLPLSKVNGKWVCDLYVLDLTRGWEALVMAFQVREIKKIPKLVKVN